MRTKRIELLLNVAMVVVGAIIFIIGMTTLDMPAREAPVALLVETDTPEPTATPTETATPTPEATFTPAATEAPPTPLPTATATPTWTPTPTAQPWPSVAPDVLTSTLNIVLLGSDHRPDDPTWRTDTIIIVAIDPIRKVAGAISVPRDLWVNIPGRAPNRVNTLDEFGGPPVVKQVLGANLGLPIDYYVRVDFTGFQQAIDALGGITVNVDCPLREAYLDPTRPDGLRHVFFPPGKVPMDGQMALDYSRSRLSTSIFDRMRRQAKVLLAIREKILSPETFLRIPELWNTMNKLVQTDVPAYNILPLARLGAEIKPADIHGLLIDQTMTRQTFSPQGYWILIADQEKVRAAVRNLFNGPTMAESVQKKACG